MNVPAEVYLLGSFVLIGLIWTSVLFFVHFGKCGGCCGSCLNKSRLIHGTGWMRASSAQLGVTYDVDVMLVLNYLYFVVCVNVFCVVGGSVNAGMNYYFFSDNLDPFAVPLDLVDLCDFRCSAVLNGVLAPPNLLVRAPLPRVFGLYLSSIAAVSGCK